MKLATPNLPPHPLAEYLQPGIFAAAGESLTFEAGPDQIWSFPRAHLIYAECDATTIRFRFPLALVEVMAVP